METGAVLPHPTGWNRRERRTRRNGGWVSTCPHTLRFHRSLLFPSSVTKGSFRRDRHSGFQPRRGRHSIAQGAALGFGWQSSCQPQRGETSASRPRCHAPLGLHDKCSIDSQGFALGYRICPRWGQNRNAGDTRFLSARFGIERRKSPQRVNRIATRLTSFLPSHAKGWNRRKRRTRMNGGWVSMCNYSNWTVFDAKTRSRKDPQRKNLCRPANQPLGKAIIPALSCGQSPCRSLRAFATLRLCVKEIRSV